MFCQNCGRDVKFNFCDNCGQRAAGAPAPPPRDPLASTRNTARIGAAIALIGFMFPWLSSHFEGKVQTGIQAASNGAVLLWILPLSMVAAIGVLLNRRVTSKQERFAAKIVMTAALASIAVVVLYHLAMYYNYEEVPPLLRPEVEYGAGISLVASAMVGIAGLMHLRAAKKLSPPGVSQPPASLAA